MLKRLSTWLAPTLEDPYLARRQYMLNVVLFSLAGPGFLFGLVSLVLWLLDKTISAGAVAGLGVQLFYLLAYWLGRRGRVRLAGYIPVIALFLVMVGGSYQAGIGHVSLAGFALVVSTASMLIGSSGALAFTLLSAIAYFLIGTIQQAGNLPGALPPEDFLIVDVAGLALGMTVLVIFNTFYDREMNRALRQEQGLGAELEEHRAQLEQQVGERTRELERRSIQLWTAAQVAQEAAAIQDVEQLLRETVRLVSDRFGFYHTGIFLLDEAREYAVLRAASSEGGRRMLARGHRLKVGEVGIVGYVTGRGEHCIALDVGADATYFDNPDLPNTRSGIALPLKARGEIIGALDVQSDEPEAVNQEDVAVLQTLANQIAMALDSARLLAEAQSALETTRHAYGELSRQSWMKLIRARPGIGKRYDPQGILSTDGKRRGEMEPTAQRGETVLGESGPSAVAAVPIKVRGQ